MVVRCAGNIPKDIPSPAILAMQESTLHQRRQVASAQLKHQASISNSRTLLCTIEIYNITTSNAL